MASTKEMMARAKARKQQSNQRDVFNEVALCDALARLANTLINFNPQQSYDCDDNMMFAAKGLVSKGLTKQNLEQLLQFRAKFEFGIQKNHNIVLPTGAGAFAVDVDALLIDAGVSQYNRVVMGLLDTVIAVVSLG